MATRRTVLWQIALRVSANAEEPAAALLERELGESPVTYVDFETGDRSISVYSPNPLSAKGRRRLQAGLEELQQSGFTTQPATLSCVRVRLEDWAHAWKIHFRPIRIAGRVVLRPSWRRVQRRPGQVIVTLDPGLAFGTGHHPTTAFCLAQIVDCERGATRPLSLLDVGTGSGILAIAAAKLGYGPIEAFDIEAESVAIAQANARRNRVGHKIRFSQRDVRALPRGRRGRFDLVCANLVADLLVQERERLASQVAPGGRLVLAGVLGREFDGVENSYRTLGFRLFKTHQEGEWQSGAFVRAVRGQRR